ncbi:arsenite methyltransferase [Megasphaera paucivorans]|uniref:Arsenite methyltransferase n=1 Tax=Megasphaera paucivorans TaxID=349095 RepID=A0A1G9RIV6_9FIRM|nr:arsenite methyltransferase [Megasphaera paucivorans]SDM23154.1 Methylase involved in ubiquinone/menaquinone biosynthesis [Megasphaera paucivorans]
MKDNELREVVREKYAKAIVGANRVCCGDSCSNDSKNTITGGLYSTEEIQGLPQDMIAASFGCGNPTALGSLHAGETVLDLGSGAGLDVLLSARRIGPSGKAYGLDMTDEMLAEANANKNKANIANAEFLKGYIEEIPLPDGEIDAVISNCVINLSGDKDQVFREIYRVLKPGGRIAVSDIVITKPLPDTIRRDLFSWAGCISGALLHTEYEKKLKEAGFENIEVRTTRTYDLTELFMQQRVSSNITNEIEEWNGALISAFIRAKKPAQSLVEGADFNIKIAEQKDFPQIYNLLEHSGLPVSGVSDDTGKYYIAQGTSIMGVLGFEIYNDVALLRSLAVCPKFKKSGIASKLIQYVLNILREQRCKGVYLLTNTAETYLSRYDFISISRDAVPVDILETSSLGNICPKTSTCMYLNLSKEKKYDGNTKK